MATDQQSLEYSSTARRVLIALVVLGVLLRVAVFCWNSSLWHDELLLAVSLVERGPVGLFQPLEFGQVAPPLFLVATDILTSVFGVSEWVLRFIPLVASVLSLFCFVLFVRDRFTPLVQVSSVSVLAFAPGIVLFSANFKPYTFDVFATVLLLLIFFQDIGSTRSRYLSVIALLLLPWFSFSSIFIATGLGAGLCLNGILNRNQQYFFRGLQFNLICLLSFTVMYFVFVRSNTATTELRDMWATAYFSFPFIDKVNFAVLSEGVSRITFPAMSGAVWVLLFGVLCAWAHSMRSMLLPLGLAFVAVLVAASLHLYPFYGRMIFFLCPVVAILSCGLFTMLERLIGERKWVLCAVPILIASFGIKDLYGYCVNSPDIQQVREAFDFVASNQSPKDRVYLHDAFDAFYTYYSQQTDRYQGIDSSRVCSAEQLVQAGRPASFWLLAETRLTHHAESLDQVLTELERLIAADSERHYIYSFHEFKGVRVIYAQVVMSQ